MTLDRTSGGRPGFDRLKDIAGAPLVVAACVALVFLVLHLAFLDRAHPDALYMDSLRLLHQLQEWRQGRMSFLELWGLGSAHRGFINQAALLANIHLFSVDVLLANRLTGVVTGLVAFILVLAFNRQMLGMGRGATAGRGAIAAAAAGENAMAMLLRWLVSALIAALCFSWTGFELFTLDLGLPLWTKNLCFVLFFAAHARFMARDDAAPTRSGTTLLLTLAGAFIVLFVGMGWSYAFAGAVCAVHLLAGVTEARRGQYGWLRLRGLPTLGLLLALVVSLSQGGGGGEGGDEDVFGQLPAALPRIVGLAFHALGSTWLGVEVLAARGWPLSVAFWLGLACAVLAAAVLLSRLRRGLRSGSLLPLYLLAYGALTALSVAAARGDAGAAAVMASRYYMDLVLFMVGLLWLLAEHVRASRHGLPAAMALLATCGALGSMLWLTHEREWQVAPYRAQNFQAMNRALYLGVPGDADALLLQSPLEHARQGARILRDQGLGPFAGLGSAACSVARIIHADGWNAREGDTVWMGRQARMVVPPCSCALVAQLYLPETFPERTLRLGNGAGATLELTLAPGTRVQLALPPGPDEQTWELAVSRATVPARDLPGAVDGRELGVLWSGLAFPCATEAAR